MPPPPVYSASSALRLFRKLHPAKTEVPQRAPILVMHGLFGGSFNWTGVSNSLSKSGWNVTCVDLRNHGDSPWHPTMDYNSMAADATAVVDGFSERSVVMGHSMGGRVAMYMALAESVKPVEERKISSVVIVDVSPTQSESSNLMQKYCAAMLRVTQETPPPKLYGGELRKTVDKLLTPEISDDAVRAFLLRSLVVNKTLIESSDEVNKLQWKFNLPVLADALPKLTIFPKYFLERGAKFDGPAFFVGGANSDYIKNNDQEIKELFPNAEFAFVPEAGHWPHADNPSVFEQLVTNFLKTVK